LERFIGYVDKGADKKSQQYGRRDMGENVNRGEVIQPIQCLKDD
jgi:hypothetical protein